MIKFTKIFSELTKCVRNNPVAIRELTKLKSRTVVKHKNVYENQQLKFKRIYKNFIKKYIFNPKEHTDVGRITRRKRIILLDGSSIAFEHGKSRRFSVMGIKLANDYFRRLGNYTQIIIPDYRLLPGKSDDYVLLQEMREKKLFILTPTHQETDVKTGKDQDSRFLLRIAYEHDSAIVSNDKFLNLYDESPDYQIVINNRIIPFSWNRNDLLLPVRPYGNEGPSLAEILNH